MREAWNSECDDLPSLDPTAWHRATGSTAAARSNAVRRVAGEAAMAAVSATAGMLHHLRQAIGDPSTPANDNEYFPLLETLRRKRDAGGERLVLRYLRLAACVAAQPLQGVDYGYDRGHAVDRRINPLRGDVDAAAAKGWPSHTVHGGEIEYREVRKSRSVRGDVGRRKVPVNVDTAYRMDEGQDYQPPTGAVALHRTWSNAALVEWLDAKPVFGELRAALGPLLDPFEEAVLDRRTFTEIGRARGYKTKPDVAGSALVTTALYALGAAWRDIDKRQAAATRDAESNVIDFRKAIKARRLVVPPKVAKAA